ncbi:MAG: tetratricopeptide repeat protein [Gammaproteobacteria bacterium]
MTVAAQDVTPDLAPSSGYETRWHALTDAGDHSGAIELTQAWIADSKIRDADNPWGTFKPLTRLAAAYTASGEDRLAMNSYREAIALGSVHLGAFSPELIEPLIELSALLSANDLQDEALSALLRAKGITHRNQGIYNSEQERIVDSMSDIYLELDDVQQATLEQRLLYSMEARQVGEDSPDFVPAIQKWAQFLARIERYRDARQFLRRAVEILENAYGPNDVRIVDSLNLIADSFRSNEESKLPPEGRKALQRAVSIYRAQDNVDHADLMQAQQALGDWYMTIGSQKRALETYREAISVAQEAGVNQDTIDAQFARPKRLGINDRIVETARRRMQQNKDASLLDVEGTVVFEFDVDQYGLPRNIHVIKNTIDRRTVVAILRSKVRLLVYRPRYKNGVAVPTKGVRREYIF